MCNGTDLLSGFLPGFENIQHPRAPCPSPRQECRTCLPTALHTSSSTCACVPWYAQHFQVWKVNHTQQGAKQFFNGQEDEISNSAVLAEATTEMCLL